MLKDLFFNIWFDDLGTGWLMLVLLLFIITLTAIIFVIVYVKNKNQKFTLKHILFFIISALIIYQIIPTGLHFLSIFLGYEQSLEKSIAIEKNAIKTSIIPWQKGGYYCCLANLYLQNKDYKNMKTSLDNAYKYINSYKYPCWGIQWLAFEYFGNYDAAIESALNFKIQGKPSPAYAFVAGCYIKKGDLDSAMEYINKDIQFKGEKSGNLALKAYILKKSGNITESKNVYIKAMSLCKNDKEKIYANNTYTDYLGYEKKRIENSQFKKKMEK